MIKPFPFTGKAFDKFFKITYDEITENARVKVHKLSTRPGLNERFAKEKCGEAMDFAFGYVDKAFEDMVTHGSEERIFNEVLKRLEIKFERKSHELIEGAVDCWRVYKMTDLEHVLQK